MQDIVLFGTGEVGKLAVPFLEEDRQILFWVDNDERKWGSIFENYTVKSPEAVMQCDCDIVITSTKYASEIAEQLKDMGICQDRLYFSRRFQKDDMYEYEVYPVKEEKILNTGRLLIQYDLYKTAEYKTEHKKIMIFCTFFSTFTKQLIENMSKRYDDIEFSLLTNDKESMEMIEAEELKHIYYFQTMSDLKTILELLPEYDVMHLLWIEWEWAYFYKLIKKKAVRLILSIGGSDFYRAGKGKREFKRNLIACADTVTAATETTAREFVAHYGEDTKNKIVLLHYGIEVLELINQNENVPKKVIKEKYHIPCDKIVITCGHNAGEAHQHKKIIEALDKLPKDMKKQLVCVFPMTYPQGRDAYIRNIKERAEEAGLEYVILTEYMDSQGMAEYALISDVMIHVQTTDLFSSTMREEMYAGSIIIAGKWLPYQTLHDMGIFFLDVNEVADVTAALEDVIVKMEEYRKKCTWNKEIIWKSFAWDELAPKWHNLWK